MLAMPSLVRAKISFPVFFLFKRYGQHALDILVNHGSFDPGLIGLSKFRRGLLHVCNLAGPPVGAMRASAGGRGEDRRGVAAVGTAGAMLGAPQPISGLRQDY
jgi:hypothetical protein